MHLLPLLTFALPLLSTTFAQYTCDPSCKSCGLICDAGCDAPLDYTKCTSKCLNCRRESSYCGWWQFSNDDPDFCDLCLNSCWCKIGTMCYDNVTGSATASSAPTAVAGRRGMGLHDPFQRD